MNTGRLHLIPVALSGAGNLQLSLESIEAAKQLFCFVAERSKSARQYLKSIKHPKPQSEIEVLEIPRDGILNFFEEIIAKIKSGKDIGLVSEAGMPCIADPGYELVALAHQNSIEVLPYAGPNSMMIALMASGLYAQEYCFHGYLPAKKEELRNRLSQLANQMKKSNATHLFMETPYRTLSMISTLVHHISPDWNLCIASALGTPDQKIALRKIKNWKPEYWTDHEGKPSIFILSNN